MSRPKISIIGAGHVGATTAFKIAELELGDVVLVDIIEDMPQGKALDLMEMGPISGYDVDIKGTNAYDDTENSDIVVVFVAHKVSKFPMGRIMGMAGVLDSTRFRTFISMELGVSVENIHAFVLGGHGDDMVPLARYTTVAGVPITELLPEDRIDSIIQRTRDGGAEIVKLLKTGSAFYAPAASTAEMVESILKDKKKILPCCVMANGKYGIKDAFVGLPVKLGRAGVEEIFEIDLTKEELDKLHVSANHVKELIKRIHELGVI
jgi:malate dehydrogenase